MNRFLLPLLTVLVLFSACQESTLTTETGYVDKLDEQIPAWMEEFIVPGSAIAIIEDGKVSHLKAYGLADVENGTAASAQTGFNIASISKTVSAWGVMKLVEQGKLDLDAPAEKYLSRWHLPESEFDANEVTIRRLLSHTAGLSLHGYPGFAPEDTLPSIEESLSGKTNGAGNVHIDQKPGMDFRYSGGGYTLLQLIVEEVTGKPFATYMHKEVLLPLGMTNSSFAIDNKILAASSKEYGTFGKEIPFEHFTAQAAAGLHTTIEDISKFALASLQADSSGNAVLSAESIELMQQPHAEANERYGLGYSMQSPRNTEEKFVGHGGSNDGWQAYLQLHPASKSGFVMFTNSGNGRTVYNYACDAWMKEHWGIEPRDRGKPFIPLMVRTYEEKGIEAAIAAYKDVMATTDDYDFSPWDMNLFGYNLLWDDKLDDAQAIFELNVQEDPGWGNAWDSYAEVLLAQGDTVNSILNYQKSVVIDPRNENGIMMLEKLGAEIPEPVKYESILDAPEDWGKEIIPIPIDFAPSIDLNGMEELRFTPNWRDTTLANNWTYTMVWYVEDDKEITSELLTKYTNAYYDGLMRVRNHKRRGALPTASTFTKTPDGYEGRMDVYDAFFRDKMMVLNLKVRERHCAQSGKLLLTFEVSPQSYEHPVWEEFKKVRTTVDCG